MSVTQVCKLKASSLEGSRLSRLGRRVPRAMDFAGRFVLLLVFASVLLGSLDASSIQAQPSALGAFEIRRFGPEDYDAHLQNWVVSQDYRGFIYAANSWGILEYDGIRWRLIDPGVSTFFPAMEVHANRIYLGGNEQFGYLAPDSIGSWAYRSLSDLLMPWQGKPVRIRTIHSTSRGAFFLGERQSFFWDDRTVKPIPFQRPVASSFMIGDTLYVGFETGGMAYLADDLPVQVPLGREWERMTVVTAAARPDAALVVLTSAGIQVCERQDFSGCRVLSEDSRRVLAGKSVRDLVLLNNGWIAVATGDSGIITFDEHGAFQRVIDATQGLPSIDVKDLHVDQMGGLWAGLSNGLVRIDIDLSTTFYGEEQGLRGKVVVAMALFGNQLYVTTDDGVYRLSTPEPDRMEALEPVTGLSSACYRIAAGNDALFLGCEDGLYRVTGDEATRLFALPEMPRTIYPSPFDPGRVYIGLSQTVVIGVRTSDGWSAEQFPLDTPDRVSRIYQEDERTLWLGTHSHGVASVELDDAGEPASLERYGETEGLPQGLVTPFDLGGTTAFLMGSDASGLYKMVESTAGVRFVADVRFSEAFNESDMQTTWIQKDVRGHYWLAGQARLVEMIPADDGGYTFNPLPALQRRMYRQKLVNILAGPDGILWSSWVGRLVRHDPSVSSDPVSISPVTIRSLRAQERVLFDGIEHDGLHDLSIDHDVGRIRIDYASVDLSDIGGIEYRSLLEGLEDDWSLWGGETYREFTNLGAATYTFRVQARDPYGRMGEASSITFTVLPAWYQTSWAYFLWIMLLSFGLALLMHTYNRFHMSRLKEQNAELESEVALRTLQIREKQAELEKVNGELNTLNERLRGAYRVAGDKNKELRKKNQALLIVNKALNDRSEELREALEENKEILGITAHDLKNPLSGIIGMAEIILYDAQSMEPKAYREESVINTRMMKDQAEMMLQIIKDLLDKYRSGTQEDLRFERTNLSDLVESVLPWNSRRANEKNIRIHFERGEGFEADVDVSAIQRAIDNLVSNAVKYNYPGGNVYVGLQRNGERIRFTVRDEGQGLTEEDKKKVFGKLQRLSARPTGGEYSTGLGLYIVKQLIEHHKGRVGVESKFGEGATFWFELPIIKSSVISQRINSLRN